MNSAARSGHAKANAERVLMPREAITLIESAVAAIESDRDRARQCLSQASALLRGVPLALANTSATRGPMAVRGGLAQWQLGRVITHIEAHLAGPIRTRELAGITRLSTSHFFRGFKARMGTTPFMFIARRRIARACELMKTTDDSLSQIAIDCGLCDQAHLCRVFRRIIGTTPSAWRRINAPGPREPSSDQAISLDKIAFDSIIPASLEHLRVSLERVD
jgi:AraC family transcriptional regulator